MRSLCSGEQASEAGRRGGLTWRAGGIGRASRSRRAFARATRGRSHARSRSSRTAIRSPTISSATSIRTPAGTYAVGITGPPGVGKSSLISGLIGHIRAQERTIGVISVDPSSPFTHGALLGDRIRLADHFLDPGVFIRSMGTRGHLGGLAETTLQALLVLDAAGKDARLSRDRGRRSERGRGDRHCRYRRPRTHARLRRLGAGAQGGDHGDSGRDRDQQDGPPGCEDDAEGGALNPLARPRPSLEAADRLDRGDQGREHPRALARRWRSIERISSQAACSRSGGARISPVRCSRSHRDGPSRICERAVADDPELRRLLDEVQRRELDPLTAVKGDHGEGVQAWRYDGSHRHSLTSRRRASVSGNRGRDSDLSLGDVLAPRGPRGATQGGEPPADRLRSRSAAL